MEKEPEQPQLKKLDHPPLTHLDEYKALREEVSLYQGEMHRTWLWAIIPAGAVYTWLSLHTGELSIPWPVWFIPTGFFIICYGRWRAFESRIAVFSGYVWELEEAAFGNGKDDELRGIAHYNLKHLDEPRKNHLAPTKLVRRARWVWKLLIILSVLLSFFLSVKPCSQPKGTGSASSQTTSNATVGQSLQPAVTTPVK
jgi:hypothetical protein